MLERDRKFKAYEKYPDYDDMYLLVTPWKNLDPANQHEKWIIMCRESHGYTYDYARSCYLNYKGYVKVECPIHGFWKCRADHHAVDRTGCPVCSSYNYACLYREKKLQQERGIPPREASLYVIRIFNEEESFFKVGFTFFDVKKRFQNCDLPEYRYEVIEQVRMRSSAQALALEMYLHEENRIYSYQPKHKFAGWTECYDRKIVIPKNFDEIIYIPTTLLDHL